MATATRMLHLNVFLMTTGHHEASWQLPESDPHASTDVRHYVNLARIAERAAFDSLFLSDGPVLYRDVGRRPCGYLELLTRLGGGGHRTPASPARPASTAPRRDRVTRSWTPGR